MLVLLTGASGFVGQAVRTRLLRDGSHTLRSAFRCLPGPGAFVGEQVCKAPDLGAESDWSQCLSGVEAVIHCAARVHVMKEVEADPGSAFYQANTLGTLQLAQQAVQAGVRRFVYLSSIKVNGEETRPGQVFRADDKPATEDPYGISKRDAEEYLLDLAEETGLEVVIIRPPLIYGPGVKANFLTMMRWLQKGIPLPLGSIENRRSLVFIHNLVDLLCICLQHPAAVNQRFLVSDGEDLSTPALLSRLGIALDRPARLLPVPQSWLVNLAKLFGRTDLTRRLSGSLQVDIDKTRELLDWAPPITVDRALAITAAHFLDSQSK